MITGSMILAGILAVAAAVAFFIWCAWGGSVED